MSIELEYDELSGKYFIHDMIDGWDTAEISKEQYLRFKAEGISMDEKHSLNWEGPTY